MALSNFYISFKTQQTKVPTSVYSKTRKIGTAVFGIRKIATNLIAESNHLLITIINDRFNYTKPMKFKSLDEQYFARREAFAKQIKNPELWNLIDHWPLYVGNVNLARNLAISDLFRSTLSVPGDAVEFGCWKGSTTLLLAKLLKIYDPNGPKLVHVFDSFEGLTQFHVADASATNQFGNYQGSRQHLEDCAKLADVHEMISIHEGSIENTLPVFVGQQKQSKFSFVLCDTDLYSSTSTIMQHMWGQLSIGGIMVFDQWNTLEFPGEGIAVNEFLESIPASFEMIKPQNTRQPSLALRRKL